MVALAVPMYSNAAGTIPIVQALLGKGMPLGTTLAFMMSRSRPHSVLRFPVIVAGVQP